MYYALYHLARVVLWLVQCLPQKPQPSQVRDTQPEPPIVTPRPIYRPPAPQERFTDISRVPNAIDKHLEKHQRIMDAYQRLEASDRYRPAQEWNYVAVPRHQRDLDLVNYLKHIGKI